MAITDPTGPFGEHFLKSADAAQEKVSGRNDFSGPLARLGQLHAEGEQTLQLAGLLRRAAPAAGLLMLFGAVTFALGGGSGNLAKNFAWAALVLIGIGAILRLAIEAGRGPVARASLGSFAGDLVAAFAYTGFAWGAGAFLALPPHAGMTGILAFAAAPCLLLAVLLRERLCVFAFLGPVAALTVLAAYLAGTPAPL